MKTEQDLKDRINAALAKWEAELQALDMPQYRKDFHVSQIKWHAHELLNIGHTIRQYQSVDTEAWWNKGGRACLGLIDELVAVGQRHTSTLFSCGLRDKISDHIENFYGINFSGLSIAQRYNHLTDDSFIYVWRLDSNMQDDSKVSYVKDSTQAWMPYSEFKAQYVKPAEPTTK